jgi:hypothetical protein
MLNPFPLEIGTLQVIPETCIGANDASILFEGLGGWQPLTQEISNDDGQSFSSYNQLLSLSSGDYTIQLTDQEGCKISEKISLDEPPLFDVNFLSASQIYVGDTLLIIEVSFPKPDSLAWDFSDGFISYLPGESFPLISYDQPGEYDIVLTAFKGNCSQSMTKTVTFLPADQKPTGGRMELGLVGIKGIRVFPHPTQGEVQVQVDLHRQQTLGVFLYNLQGFEMQRQLYPSNDLHVFKLDLSDYNKGAYVLKVATENDREEVKIILN